jgi:Fic family protein
MLAKRTYLRTHPWINFNLQADRFDHETWMMLGEAASKANHIAGAPLSPSAAKAMLQVFVAKGALATAAIEGNTLTEEQVLQQVQGKLKLPPSQEYLQREVQNIIDACNWIVDDLSKNGTRKIDLDFCCTLNAKVLDGLVLDEGTKGGKIRQHEVVVGNVYKGAPAEDCRYLVEELGSHLERIASEKNDGYHMAILSALFAHMYMALIHPFGDGNGRTARLLEFYILLRAGLSQPTGHLLSNHYNLTRNVYYRELDKISKTGGDTHGFIKYALHGFVDGLKEQIDRIRVEQMRVTWINYVHEKFDGEHSVTDQRRRSLVLALGDRNRPAKVSELEELTVKVSKFYNGKTDKTLTRDINALVSMGLARRLSGRRLEAAIDTIEAFLPWKLPT